MKTSTIRAGRAPFVLLALFVLLGPLSLFPNSSLAAGPISISLIRPTGVDCCKNLTSVGSKLLFGATDGTHGQELWSSDGTLSGTKMVKDINPKGDARPGAFSPSGSTVFFMADDGNHKANDLTYAFKWWSSDGTKNGTKAVKSLLGNRYSNFSPPVRVGSKTITFGENNLGADASSTELWASDGTAKGTLKVAKLNLHGQSDRPTPYVFKSKIFYQSTDTSKGPELWTSDGTVKGTKFIKKFSNKAWINFCCSIGTKLFFSAANGTDGTKLWSTDGTPSGTQVVSNDVTTANGDYTAFGSYAIYNSKLYFTGHDVSREDQIWSTDGTTVGTRVVTNLDTKTYAGPWNLTFVGSKLYFDVSVYDPTSGASNGVALFSISGAPESTQLVKVINSQAYSGIRKMAAFGTSLLIASTPKDYQGLGLWISDGTSDGTKLVSTSSFSTRTDVIEMITLGFNTYFTASSGDTSNLWKIVIGN